MRGAENSNTFAGSRCAIELHAGKTGNVIKNNIFQGGAAASFAWPRKALPQALDYNIYFSAAAEPRWQRDGVAYRGFRAYQQAAGETHSMYADPKVAGPADARLTSGSPAIDTGVTLKEVSEDFGGIARPQGAAYDIGAYESPFAVKFQNR